MSNKKSCNQANCCSDKERAEKNTIKNCSGSSMKKRANSPTSFCQSFEKNRGIITDNEYEVKSEIDDNIKEVN